MRGIEQESRVMWHAIQCLEASKSKAFGRCEVAERRETLEIRRFSGPFSCCVPTLRSADVSASDPVEREHIEEPVSATGAKQRPNKNRLPF